MRPLLIFLIALISTSCSEKSTPVTKQQESEVIKAPSPILRSIDIIFTEDDYSIELNDGKGYLKQGEKGEVSSPLPPKKVTNLINSFYKIPNIMSYVGTDKDNRQSKIHHLLMLFDDLHDGKFIDFVIPRSHVNKNPEMKQWFQNMKQIKHQTNEANKAANKSQ